MKSTTSRRNALKFLGLGGITTAIAPTVLLQACKEAAEQVETYTYSVFNEAQAAAVKAIQDAIIPKTDTPSASELGSVEFLDTYTKHGLEEKDQKRMLYRIDKFAEALKAEASADASSATPEQINAMLDKYYVNYKAPESAEDAGIEIEGNKIDTGSEGGDADAIVYKDDATEINELLQGIRWATLESYFQSEQIAEEVLNYLEVPGEYVGQLPMSEVPNGYAWSL